MAEKEKKIRLKCDTEPLVRRALLLRAVLEDIDLQDVINAALRSYLAEEIKEVQRRGLVSDPKEPEDKGRRARKGKDDHSQA